MLAKALRNSGDDEGAIAAFRLFVALRPSRVDMQEVAWSLAPKGSLEEVRAGWEKLLERDPSDHGDWYGYAQLCAFLENEGAYRKAREGLLKRFAEAPQDDWVLGERVSIACLLLPGSAAQLRSAIRFAQGTVSAGEKAGASGNPYLQFVKGLALYRDGRPEAAVPLLREAAKNLDDRAGPWMALAMAQFQSGSKIDARRTLATGVSRYDWKQPRLALHADQSTLWVSHVLRREAEMMILPHFEAFLAGTYQPQENDERLAMLGICLARGQYRKAAQLFVDAFARDSGLGDRLSLECVRRAIDGYGSRRDPKAPFNTACRYLAARCAALAGCGLGKVGAAVSDEERNHWRKMARRWLREDLVMWTSKVKGADPLERDLATKMLTGWQTEPDLAGMREPFALDDFSAAERHDCYAFWHEVRDSLKRSGGSRETIARVPKPAGSESPSPSVLLRLGRLNEARLVWKSAIAAEPLEHGVASGYAELCLFLGEDDEYRVARRALLDRFGEQTDPYVAERTARACLLKPGSGDELRQAVAVAERAFARNQAEQSARPYFEFVRGLADYRQGHFDQAISTMRGDASQVLGPCPMLVLAMALFKKGQTNEGRETLASAVLSYDWSANLVRDVHGCIAHVLRREAEAILLPNLGAFLDEKYRPRHNDERLALLGVCQFTNRTCAAAQLYADTFTADQRLAEDLRAGHRSKAARAAALAGCGLGQDASKLRPDERSHWRRQASDWLRADLEACTRWFNSEPASARDFVRNLLASWKADPNLAGLRDPSATVKLPADEQDRCLALWQSVDKLLRLVRQAK
jgi:tetratricopeptide (TPR) repeat protein